MALLPSHPARRGRRGRLTVAVRFRRRSLAARLRCLTAPRITSAQRLHAQPADLRAVGGQAGELDERRAICAIGQHERHRSAATGYGVAPRAGCMQGAGGRCSIPRFALSVALACWQPSTTSASSSLGVQPTMRRCTGNGGTNNMGGFYAWGQSRRAAVVLPTSKPTKPSSSPSHPSTAQLDRLVAGLMARHGVA